MDWGTVMIGVPLYKASRRWLLHNELRGLAARASSSWLRRGWLVAQGEVIRSEVLPGDGSGIPGKRSNGGARAGDLPGERRLP